MPSDKELALKLLEALGLSDQKVAKLTITFEPQRPAVIEALMYLPKSSNEKGIEEFATELKMFRLLDSEMYDQLTKDAQSAQTGWLTREQAREKF